MAKPKGGAGCSGDCKNSGIAGTRQAYSPNEPVEQRDPVSGALQMTGKHRPGPRLYSPKNRSIWCGEVSSFLPALLQGLITTVFCRRSRHRGGDTPLTASGRDGQAAKIAA